MDSEVLEEITECQENILNLEAMASSGSCLDDIKDIPYFRQNLIKICSLAVHATEELECHLGLEPDSLNIKYVLDCVYNLDLENKLEDGIFIQNLCNEIDNLIPNSLEFRNEMLKLNLEELNNA